MKRVWTNLRYSLYGFRGQILGWGLGIASLGLIIVPFYDVFVGEQSEFMQMIENYPPEFLAFFGGDAAALVTPEGFLGMYGFSLLPLIIGLFAVLAGSGLLAVDEERGRLDLILAHPVGRTALFAGRLLGLLGATIGILLLGWLGFSVLLGTSSLPITWGEMLLPFLPLFGQALVYATLALLLSQLLPNRALAATLAGLVMVGGYLLDSLANLNENLATLAKLFPYAYYQGSEAFSELNWLWLGGLLLAGLVMALLAWLRFRARDIRLSGEGSLRLPWPGRRKVQAA
jgi:ABC-2 type transport system permease protein